MLRVSTDCKEGRKSARPSTLAVEALCIGVPAWKGQPLFEGRLDPAQLLPRVSAIRGVTP